MKKFRITLARPETYEENEIEVVAFSEKRDHAIEIARVEAAEITNWVVSADRFILSRCEEIFSPGAKRWS